MDEIRVKVTKHGRRRCFYMYYDDPITGKREWRSTKKTSRREAEREAAKWEAELQEGRYKRPNNLTWEEFRERYEDEWLVTKSANTQRVMSVTFNHFEQFIGVDRLAKVNTDMISRFQAELRKALDKESTVACYMRHLRAALNWAVRKDMLRETPDFDVPKQSAGVKLMRGRAITTEEFERMLAKVEEGLLDFAQVKGKWRKPAKRKRSESTLQRLREKQKARIASQSPAWRHYLTGLWLSGLRLEESVALSWDQDEPFCIDLSGQHPRFRIYAEAQKGRRDQFLPMTPDFAEFILQTPEAERHGRVFNVGASGNKVGVTVSCIGKRAGVVVNKADSKYASAHDLRRAFGTRWASKVKPATLQLLMRHRQIETTMRYYVDQDADEVAEQLWQAHGVDTFVDTGHFQTDNGSDSRSVETKKPVDSQRVR